MKILKIIASFLVLIWIACPAASLALGWWLYTRPIFVNICR